MRLMFILAAIISGFLTITLVFFRATRKTYPGFDQWTAGVGFLTLGYLLMCLRGLIPEPLSIILGNVAFPLGMVLQLDGIRRFLGAGVMPGVWYALPGIDLAAVAILYYLHDSPAWRHMVTSLAVSAPHWAIAALILWRPGKHKSMFYTVIGTTIGLAGLVVLARPIGTFLLPQWHLMMDSPFQIGSLAALVVLQLGENLSMIMLNGERVESDLAEAETELRATIDQLEKSLAEQKRTEESLRESEERYRAFFDTSRDCVFMTTVDGRFIEFNDAGLEMLGYSPGDRPEMLRKEVASFYANPQERDAHSQRVAAMGFSKDYPVDFRKKDGTIIQALVTTVARKGPDGSVIGFQGTVRDISDRKKAENALRTSEERYRAVFDNAGIGIDLLDREGRILRVNQSLLDMLGYAEEDLRQLTFLDITHPEEREISERNLEALMAGKIKSYRLEKRYLTKDGGILWGDLTVSAIRGANGEHSGTIGVISDITDRKQAEKALLESEEKYRNLFNNAEVGMFRTRLDGSAILDVNDKFLQIFGRTREEMQGNPSVTYWVDQNEREEMVRRLNAGGRVIDFECKMLNKQGEVRICITSLRLYPEQGLLEGSIMDITDLKKAEIAFKESEQRLRLAQDAAKVGTWEWDLRTNENFWSDELWTLYGLEPNSCKPSYEAWLQTIHPDDRAAAERAVQEAASQGRELNAEWRTNNVRGDSRWLMSRGQPAYDDNRQVLRYIGIVIDITDRKRTEEALRASEEKYRLLVEKSQEGIFVVQDTLFRFVNPRLEEIAGFSADELVGKSFGGLVHPDDRQAVIEKHYRRLKGEVFPSRYEIRIIDKQGRVKWAELDSASVDWEGKPAVMVFLTDTTYRKLAEEAAFQTERLKAIADLSAGVAHHFNNLLQIVMASASLSLADLESGDGTKIKTTLENMIESASRGAEMVKRLQTFADVRSDVTKAEAATFDVAATVKNAAEVSKPFWKAEPEKRGTEVNLQLDLEDGCVVRGKENEISEVLVHLLRNAAEALPDGGDIEVKAFKEADEVIINVRDTGIGIAKDDLPRLFQPFWSSKGVGIGKGMGLAVTHGLVKRHGGTISVQSKVGEGTIFTIRLPRAQEPVTKAESPSATNTVTI